MLLLALLLAPGGAWGAQAREGGAVMSLSALGSAPAGENQMAAREAALADALRLAVAQAATGMVDPATLSAHLAELQRDVLAKARQFVDSYTIRGQGLEAGQVLVLASVNVNRPALDQALARIGLRLPAARLALTLVLVAEEASPGRPPVYWWSGSSEVPAAPRSVSSVLEALSVKTVDPKVLAGRIPPEARQAVLSEEVALRLGSLAGAGLVILGRVRTYPLVSAQGEDPPPVAQFLALDVAGGRSLAVAEEEGPIYHSAPGPQAGAEVRQAAQVALRKLLEQVAGSAAQTKVEKTRLRLTIRGLRSLGDLHRFVEVLGSMGTMVEGVGREASGSGWATLLLELRAPVSQLADQLLLQDFGGFLVNVTGSGEDSLELMLIPKN